MILVSFLLFLLMFVGIGLASTLKRKSTNEDYLLAGRSVKPWLVALSAVATWNSGFMFIGMIGFTYFSGLSAIWLAIGWIVGDFLMSLFVHARLRETTEKRQSLTFAGVLSQWHGTDFRKLRLIGGVLTIVFLGAYAAAQLNAGSKAMHVLFGWDYGIGAIIGCLIVVAYCFAGGIRASIWTDAAQSVVMIVSMLLLAIVAISSVGGVAAFTDALVNVSPSYMSLFPEGMRLGPLMGPVMFVAGWIFAGFSVIGQPHVMVRFMTMDSAQNMGRTRLYYYLWYGGFCVVTILAGLSARVLLPESASFDAELALPLLSLELLPSVLVGLILAGIFAATMSTADSQIMSCSASLTRDVFQSGKVSYIYTKVATVLVALISLTIALIGPQSVFSLVLIAAGALASAFAPLLMVYCLGGKPTEGLAITMMVLGLAAMFAWRAFGLTDITYEVLPGMVAGLATFAAGRLGGWTIGSQRGS